jgi:glycosyltransferase involved in cell wall biosynthesis
MKILITTPMMPPTIGGPATYVALLQKELPLRDVDIEVVSFDTLAHLPKGLKHLVFFFKVFKVAKKVDVVYAQDPLSTGLPTCLASWFRRKPFLLKVVGDYAWEQGVNRFGVTDSLDAFASKRTHSLPVAIFKYLERGVARSARQIIVPSQYLKKIVETWGVSREKITVILNAFDIPNIETEELSRSGTTIFSAGRLVSWKGFDILIRAIPFLPDEVTVSIAGEGPDKKRLLNIVDEMGLQDRVNFLGRLEHKVLLQKLAEARLFVLASSYEGLSHQLLEALALGTPVVATNIGGNPEVITHRRDGLLVSYGDEKLLAEAIREMLTNDEFVQLCVENGQKKIELFSTDIMIESLVKVLNTYASR